MGVVAFDGGNLGRYVINALAALQCAPGGIQIANVGKRAFDFESCQCFVVVLVSQQHPYPDTVVQQPAHEVGAYVPGGTGDQNGWLR